jgi:hypothetical protein
VVRGWRRSDDVDAGRVAEKRSSQWHWDVDGMLVLQVRMDAEAGAALLANVESRAERDARRERAAAKKAAAKKAARTAGAADGDRCPADPATFPRERMTVRRCRALPRAGRARRRGGRRRPAGR